MVPTPEPCADPPARAAEAMPTSRSGIVARTTAPLVKCFIADLPFSRRAARGDRGQRAGIPLQPSARRLASDLQGAGYTSGRSEPLSGARGEGYGAAMRFQLLGAVDVVDNGNRVPLGGPKQRLVLAHLVLHANRVIPADTLIEE